MLIVTVVFKNRITDGNAFVTNIRLGIVGGRGDQLPDYVLAFVAEGTTQSIIRASALHWDLLTDHQSLNADILIIAKLGRKHKSYPSGNRLLGISKPLGTATNIFSAEAITIISTTLLDDLTGSPNSSLAPSE